MSGTRGILDRTTTWLPGLMLGLALCAPSSAQAYNFSFGSSIAASDDITSISLAADDGMGGETLVFDTSTNTLTFTSSVSQINFSNRAAITGIPTGALVFTSVLSLNGAFTFAGNTFTAANFANGGADFTVWDDPMGMVGPPVKVLEGNFDGDGLLVTIRAQTTLAVGELSGDYTLSGGNADVVAAHGPSGSIDQSFQAGSLVGSSTFPPTLCGVIVVNTSLPSCVTGPNDWLDFDANPTSTLVPAAVPEPGLAALAFAALGGLAVLRRR